MPNGVEFSAYAMECLLSGLVERLLTLDERKFTKNVRKPRVYSAKMSPTMPKFVQKVRFVGSGGLGRDARVSSLMFAFLIQRAFV